MLHKYLSSRRGNYNLKTKECLYSAVFDSTRYFCQKTERYHKCNSCYCNIHGLANRERKCRQAERLLLGYKYYINLSIHYGEEIDLEKRKDIWAEYRRLINKYLENIKLIKIDHWQTGKRKRNKLFLHHHPIIASNKSISRRLLKAFLTEAATNCGHPSPSKIRLGYRVDTNRTGYLVYCFRIGKFKDKLVLPPADQRWELCRLRQPKKSADSTTKNDCEDTTISLEQNGEASSDIKRHQTVHNIGEQDMAIQRATWFMKDHGSGYGWSETLYKTTADLAQLLQDAKGYALLRKNLLGDGVAIEYIRVSDDSVRGDSRVAVGHYTADKKIGEKLVENQDEPADQPYSAILLRMTAGDKYRKSMYMRGAPDSVIVNPNGPNKLAADWQKAYKTWATAVKGSWGFKVFSTDAGDAPAKNITNIVGGDANWTITCPAHGFANGTKVYIGQAKGINMPHGEFVVDATTDNTFITRNATGVGVYVSGGIVRKRVPVVVTIEDIIVMGETSRHAGRPFDLRRGRRAKNAR